MAQSRANRFQHISEPSLVYHKYDFEQAIFPWSNFWIKKFQLNRHCGSRSHHSLQLLYISYALGNHNAFNKSYAEYLLTADCNNFAYLRLNHSGPLDNDGYCPWCQRLHPSAEADKLTSESETGTDLLPVDLLGIFSFFQSLSIVRPLIDSYSCH